MFPAGHRMTKMLCARSSPRKGAGTSCATSDCSKNILGCAGHYCGSVPKSCKHRANIGKISCKNSGFQRSSCKNAGVDMKARLTMATMVALCLLYVLIVLNPQSASAGQPQGSTQLQIIGKDGKVTGFIPLKHTGIKTEISGFVARIEVTQEFENVLPDAVEAVYVFPLPQDSAVDGMTMTVGEREIRAVIKERDEARKIYEQARNTGHTAALLDQERPNIFTQSVTNIPPKGTVQI